jgi:hypothetical protein
VIKENVFINNYIFDCMFMPVQNGPSPYLNVLPIFLVGWFYRVSNKEVSFSVIRNYVESNSTRYTFKSMTGPLTA